VSKGPRKPVPPRDTLKNCRELARQLDGGLITPVEAIKALQWQVWTCQHEDGSRRFQGQTDDITGLPVWPTTPFCKHCGVEMARPKPTGLVSVNPNHPTT